MMLSLARVLAWKKKSKKPVNEDVKSPSAPTHQAKVDPASPGKRACPVMAKDLEKALLATIEAPLAVVVKAVSTEIVTPLSKAVSDAWNANRGEIFGPLSHVMVDPRDVIDTININDITISVKETLMALISKMVDEVLVPFLVVLRAVLQNVVGEKYPAIIVWLEQFVHSVVPELLSVVFGKQEDSKGAKWVKSITENLLNALRAPPGDKSATRDVGKKSPDISKAVPKRADGGVGPFAKKSTWQPLASAKHLEVPVEESEDSFKETLRDFKVHVEKALN
ncbi:hypothetical protein JCM33374_g2606 [Metschnikowia sp. JCM 33374]|nr:hypothetical protein JCM33374_g2606 [Metschnikowia sp. JCM 33374]